ncbi:unnamed protein product [Phytophthora lilii]|uniref:Unnamed protein product n=1 Tax=Phytophthora lilii TaxID=2077276 RepID=A0A9W6WZA0_9STRA|nr:unnamed protein product [Phytophthora lilii]
MILLKNNQDAFSNDELARLFKVSPPSVGDERLEQSRMDYMVSALVVQLNQHLWNHTNSCFKQSRTTAHETFCRCNYDIPVLLGGSGATDRLYYCCKYVTKFQERLDSQVAVAVAALQRRQQREQIEETICGVQTHAQKARKRVASMIYNLTNRQEIAGPLAALYLHRGSYSSASCNILPLCNAIRKLTAAEKNYTCALVKDDDSLESPHYHAVSNLDDYIYPPDELQEVNLYEFTMWYFLIHGFRMPSIKNDDSKCKRAVLSLVLFKPFRDLVDLIGVSVDNADETTWLRALDDWLGTRNAVISDDDGDISGDEVTDPSWGFEEEYQVDDSMVAMWENGDEMTRCWKVRV